jgi:hypothetical protein
MNILKPKSTVSKPISQPIETAAAFEETMSPPSVAEVTAETATQVGYQPGDEVTAAVTNRKMPNKKFLFVRVPDWHDAALCAVQNADDWSAGERIRCKFVKANPAGVLVFQNLDGIRRNKWRR